MAGLLIKNTSNILLRASFLIGMVFFSMMSGQAHAIKLSTSVELVEIASVGGSFQTVTFENTYTNAVPVCTNTLAVDTDPPALVRIQSIGTTSMQIKLQKFNASSAITAGKVSCLIAELGVNSLEDGRRIEARTVLSDKTHGQNATNKYNLSSMEDMSSSFSGFTNPIALGQVISYNDSNASVFLSNDCDDRKNAAFLSGFADGICVSKSILMLTGSRSNETLGVIVIESGTGSYDGVSYDAQLGAQTIRGTGTSPPYTYTLSGSFDAAVASISGAKGGQGGWAVGYGTNLINGSSLSLAIDEYDLGGNNRGHTNERVAYLVVKQMPLFTASVEVDRTSIAEALTLNYTVTLENTGELDQNGVAVTPTLPDSTTGTVGGLTESMTTDGIFEAGETWTYTYDYSVSQAEITAGTTRTSSISVTTTEYAANTLANETASISTTIVPAAPSLNVTKTPDKTSEVAAGEVVTYTYVVENTGNQSITNVALSDAHNGSGAAPIPQNENLTADNDVNGDSVDSTSNDGVWDKLAPGDEVTFTASYTVTQIDLDTLQ